MSRRVPPCLAVACLLIIHGCAGDAGRSPSAPAEPVPPEVQTAREIAAAMFSEDHLDEAREALSPLLARTPPYTEDVLRAAVVDLAMDDTDRAASRLQQVAERAAGSPRFHYLRGMLARRNNDLDGAAREFREVQRLAPKDLPNLLMLASCLSRLGDPAAEETLRRILAVGPDNGGSWYLSATYSLSRELMKSGRVAEAQRVLHDFSVLQSQGVTAVGPIDSERGNFGRLDFPPPSPAPRAAPEPPAPFVGLELTRLPGLAGATALYAVDLVEDWQLKMKGTEVVSSKIGPLDLLATGPAGLVAATRDGHGTWSARRIFDGPISAVAWFDLGQDRDLDFWVVTGGRLLLLIADGASYRSTRDLPGLPSAPLDLQVVDFDHDGDLDLMLVGDFGMRLWRNDGAAEGGAFVDATSAAGLPMSGAFTWCLAEDLDTDQDVDLLAGGPRGTLLADNLRAGHFGIKTDRLPAGIAMEYKPVVADLDGDSRPDIWLGDGRLLLGSPGGQFHLADVPALDPAPRIPASRAAVDLNQDGELDLLWNDAAGLATALLSLGSPHQRAVDLAGQTPAAQATAVVAAVLRPEHGLDLARVTGSGVELLGGDSGNRGVLLALRGRKDNRRGVGAAVEVRAGAVYQRIYWTGEPRRIGIGSRRQADWVRVTWPNGVTQSVLGIPAGSERVIEQEEGLVESCPFVYAWNGKTFGFVTDALGVAPLGMPMTPEALVPPDHDEYLLIRGDQLRPREGAYDLRITEELREVTYLDALHLDVVDHPGDSEVYPNERFTSPPFPQPHVHAVAHVLAPTRAVGSDGADWTEALRANDLQFAAPFTPYRSQFVGLAPRHSLEVEFDPAAVRHASRLRLLLTGWFYSTDASVNIAASRTPGMAVLPPMLEVPDGRGGWRSTGPSIGFPAGKVKTMVVEAGGLLRREDPRIRLTTTLRLYWDSIRLAVDEGDALVRVTSLPPASAELAERGFSRAVELPGGHGLEWLEWDRLSAQPRWDQHPGLYTRLGGVLDLLRDIDDRLVIMGAGDALALRFDAATLPPVPDGWKRDYLLFLDGWTKDRDVNTLQGEHVEPLPFHGMSGYPYTPGERFPADSMHDDWRRDWLTRPARRWIEPLHRGVMPRPPAPR